MFVSEVADKFRAEDAYPDSTYRVFSRSFDGNKADFGLNELLFDITVCEIAQTELRGKQIPFVKRAVWLIESELSPKGMNGVADFSKLVIGDADNKLFICTREWFKCMAPIAAACRGSLFYAIVPDIKRWKVASNLVTVVYRFEHGSGNWRQISTANVVIS